MKKDTMTATHVETQTSKEQETPTEDWAVEAVEIDWSSLTVYQESPYTLAKAKENIEKDSISIIIFCGFIGCPNFDIYKTIEFQDKYDVRFSYLGCVRYWSTTNEDTNGFNEITWDHLVKKYGNQIVDDFNSLEIEEVRIEEFDKINKK